MKTKGNNDSPTLITHEVNFIADPLFIDNVFNDLFAKADQKVQSKIKFSSKYFSDFLSPNNRVAIILAQITEDEIFKVISFPSTSKSTGLDSVPTKTLKLLQLLISKHLTFIFNRSFTTTGVFVLSNSLNLSKLFHFIKKLKTGCI